MSNRFQMYNGIPLYQQMQQHQMLQMQQPNRTNQMPPPQQWMPTMQRVAPKFPTVQSQQVPDGYSLQLVKNDPPSGAFAQHQSGAKGEKGVGKEYGGGKKGDGKKGKTDAKGQGKKKGGGGKKGGKNQKKRKVQKAPMKGEGKGAVPDTPIENGATSQKPPAPKQATVADHLAQQKQATGQVGKWTRDALVFAAPNKYLSRKAMRRVKAAVGALYIKQPDVSANNREIAAQVRAFIKAEQDKAMADLALEIQNAVPGTANTISPKKATSKKVAFAEDSEEEPISPISDPDEEEEESESEEKLPSRNSAPASSSVHLNGAVEKPVVDVVDTKPAVPAATIANPVVLPKYSVPMAQDPDFWVAEVGLTSVETMAAASMLSDLVHRVNARTISRAAYLKALISASVVVIQDGAAPIQITKQQPLHQFVEPATVAVGPAPDAKSSTGQNSCMIIADAVAPMEVSQEGKDDPPAAAAAAAAADAAAAAAAAAAEAAKVAAMKMKVEQ